MRLPATEAQCLKYSLLFLIRCLPKHHLVSGTALLEADSLARAPHTFPFKADVGGSAEAATDFQLSKHNILLPERISSKGIMPHATSK